MSLPATTIIQPGDPYLKYTVGGHEKENIGYILKYKQQGFDGVVHLLPFGCMPELVTQTIIPALSAIWTCPFYPSPWTSRLVG